jgi:hypothetical protein
LLIHDPKHGKILFPFQATIFVARHVWLVIDWIIGDNVLRLCVCASCIIILYAKARGQLVKEEDEEKKKEKEKEKVAHKAMRTMQMWAKILGSARLELATLG